MTQSDGTTAEWGKEKRTVCTLPKWEEAGGRQPITEWQLWHGMECPPLAGNLYSSLTPGYQMLLQRRLVATTGNRWGEAGDLNNGQISKGKRADLARALGQVPSTPSLQ